MLRSKLLALALFLCLNAVGSSAIAQSGCGGQFAGGTLCGNKAALQGLPGPTASPVLGIPGILGGSLGIAGSGSGAATISAQNAAGTPSLLLPTSSGTLPSTAASPLVLNATSGQLSCPTCVSGIGGALVNGTTPTSGYSNTQILSSTGSVLSAYSVSGSGSVALTTSPTIASPAFTGTVTGNGTIPNAVLVNSTISGIALGANLDTLTFGTHLAAGGSSYNGSAGVTITSDATNANTSSTIVARDSSGNFNAGTIAASLTGHASLDLALTGGALSGAVTTSSTFNGLTITNNGTNTLNIAAGKTLTDTSAIGASVLLGTTGGSFAALAGNSCTNQAGTSISAAGVLGCSSITNAYLTSGAFSSITGVGTLLSGATGAGFTVALGASTVTGILPFANGGFGVNTLTAGLPIIGNGSSAPAQGTVTGASTIFATTVNTTLVPGDCPVWAAGSSGVVLGDNGTGCGANSNTPHTQDFLAGVGFTPGTTTTLTLSSAPTSTDLLYIFFDGINQSFDTWSLVGAVVTFNAAIPTNTQVVEAKWSTSSTLAGVGSINALHGALTLAAGAGINVASSGGNTLTVTNTATAGVNVDPTAAPYNAVCNEIAITGNTTIGSGSSSLTVVGASFVVGDIGKAIAVPSAGVAGAPLYTTIAGWTSSTQVTLAGTAGTALSAVSTTVSYGTDSTTALQAAITASGAIHAELDLPASTCTATAPLVITGSLRIKGQGVEPYLNGTSALGRGPGSWLHFAHLGEGFFVNGPGSAYGIISGVELVGFGTFRDQPAPGVGWTPIAADYDISISQSDVIIKDLMLLNPTKGVFLTNGGFGRLTVDNLRGQPLSIGINIENSQDIIRLSNVHFWPFWDQDPNVQAYTASNLVSLWLQHVDGPWIHNFFSIFAFNGIKISQNASGGTRLLNATNIDLDSVGGSTGTGSTGILVDSSSATGANGSFSNVLITSSVAAYGIQALGTNTDFHFANAILNGSVTAGINVASGSNSLTFSGLEIIGAGNGVVVASGSTVDIAGNPELAVSGAAYSGAGTINTTISQNVIGSSVPSIASASVVTIPNNANVVNITGTTNIGQITPSWGGRVVTLIFTGVLTVYSSTSSPSAIYLKNGANLTTSAWTGLTIAWNGSQWVETSH